MNIQLMWGLVIVIALFFMFVKFMYSQYNFTMKNYQKHPRKNPTHWGWQIAAIFTGKE